MPHRATRSLSPSPSLALRGFNVTLPATGLNDFYHRQLQSVGTEHVYFRFDTDVTWAETVSGVAFDITGSFAYNNRDIWPLEASASVYVLGDGHVDITASLNAAVSPTSFSFRAEPRGTASMFGWLERMGMSGSLSYGTGGTSLSLSGGSIFFGSSSVAVDFTIPDVSTSPGTISMTLTPTAISWMERIGVVGSYSVTTSSSGDISARLTNVVISYGASSARTSASMDISSTQTHLSVSIVPVGISWMQNFAVAGTINYGSGCTASSSCIQILPGSNGASITYGASSVAMTMDMSLLVPGTMSLSLTPTAIDWMDTVSLSASFSQGGSSSSSWPLTLSNSAFTYGSSSISFTASLDAATSPISFSVSATPTSITWLETIGLNGSVSYGSPWPMSISSSSFSYGTSSVALTASLNAATSPISFSVSATPTSITWLETIGLSGSVSYGSPWPITSSGALTYGSASVTEAFFCNAASSPINISFVAMPTDVSFLDGPQSVRAVVSVGSPWPISIDEFAVRFKPVGVYGFDTLSLSTTGLIQDTPIPSPSPPAPLPQANSSRVTFSVRVSGEVPDYTPVVKLGIALAFAELVNVTHLAVLVKVTAASVIVAISIAAPNEAHARHFAGILSTTLTNADAVTTFLASADTGGYSITAEAIVAPAIAVDPHGNALTGGGGSGSTGMIIGVICGGAVVLALIAVCIFVAVKYKTSPTKTVSVKAAEGEADNVQLQTINGKLSDEL